MRDADRGRERVRERVRERLLKPHIKQLKSIEGERARENGSGGEGDLCPMPLLIDM